MTISVCPRLAKFRDNFQTTRIANITSHGHDSIWLSTLPFYNNLEQFFPEMLLSKKQTVIHLNIVRVGKTWPLLDTGAEETAF